MYIAILSLLLIYILTYNALLNHMMMMVVVMMMIICMRLCVAGCIAQSFTSWNCGQPVYAYPQQPTGCLSSPLRWHNMRCRVWHLSRRTLTWSGDWFTLPLAPGFSDWQPCPGNSASRRANIPSDRENTSIDAECVELPSGTCLRLLLRNTVLLVWVSSGRGLG